MIAKADKPRTVKQQAWVDAMLTGVTPTEAARQAGYAKGQCDRRGYENVRKSELMLEIERKRADIGEEVKLEATAVLNRLMLISGIKTPTDDDKILSRTAGDQNKALDLLGKHLKLWDRQGETVAEPTPDLTPLEIEAADAGAKTYKLHISQAEKRA